jgi:hypothetical protein
MFVIILRKRKEEEDKDIKEFLAKHSGEDGEDCPDVVFKLAKGAWQKAVAIEFLHLHEEITGCKKDIEWGKWLSIAVFSVVVLNFLASLFRP